MGFRLVTNVGMFTRDPKVMAELARGFLRGVVANNRLYIRLRKLKGRPLPLLYKSGIMYRREPWAGRFEEFADIPTVLKRKWGDCDDLSAWRVAELQEQGESADFRIYWRPRKPGKPITMHVEVRRGDGSIEDPSRLLGL